MKLKYNTWQLTDDDSCQYVKQTTDSSFQCVETREIIDGEDSWFIVCGAEVDISDYSKQRIEDYVTGYYDNIESLYNLYGEHSNEIIVECIFECMQPWEYDYIKNKLNTLEDAKKFVQIVINSDEFRF